MKRKVINVPLTENNDLICPHCGRAIYVYWSKKNIIGGLVTKGLWDALTCHCSACGGVIIDLCQYRHILGEKTEGHPDIEMLERFRVYPVVSGRKPVPKDVPHDIALDYDEACVVLQFSPKSSAALARRCLQAVLSQHGYNEKNLMSQITSVLNEKDPSKALPLSLRETIDAIRNFGNFSAHPITDITTLQVIDVDPEEAEWCLNILEEIFEHFYVKPAQAKARKKALNEKLKSAGKRPAK